MFSHFKNFYFIGIGGIGMSALARYFKAMGFNVAGYDRTETPLTKSLENEGIKIHFEDNISLISEEFLNKKATLVIYTPAIPKEHQELNYFINNKFDIKKRAEVLGIISQKYFTIAVAGTHGKTTTSSMIAHVLHQSGKFCMAFLGGIVQNYDSNLILPERIDEHTIMVVEADEYDRSFLWLSPNMAVITSTEADHLDIYEEKHKVQDAFFDFAKKINPKGHLFLKNNLEIKQKLSQENFIKKTYSLKKGDFFVENITIHNTGFHFDFLYKNDKIENITLKMPGFHNVENATVVIAIALELGLSKNDIKTALKSYKGVKRRFEYIIENQELVYIDDYAHHPTEVEALLNSVQKMYSNKKVSVIFQPHLYSRTRDFAEGFAESLSLADEVFLLEIYPARELPIEGITSQIIFDKITSKTKKLCTKENILSFLNKNDLEIVLTVGAGDIAGLVEKVKNKLI